MCERHHLTGRFPSSKIDPCMRKFISYLQSKGIKTKSSCCGHGKYPMSVVIEENNKNIEIFSGAIIPRKTRFYKRDKEGLYYIPEAIKKKNTLT